MVVKPLGTGGANWPPSSYDPETNLFYVCTGDGAAAYSTKEGGVEWVMPKPGGRYFGGDYTRSRVPRRGVLAAVDVRTNRLAWRQQWGELCYAGSTVTRGGLLFIGRNDGRLQALDKSDGSLLWEYETDAGIHAAVSTFERGQPAVRGGALGRRVLSGHEARRQRVPVRARWRRVAEWRQGGAFGRRGGAHALAFAGTATLVP